MRGYVYTLFALLILLTTLIIIYLSAESNKNIAEFYNEQFRSEAIVSTIEQLNNNTIDSAFNISLKYNLLLLTNYSINNNINSITELKLAIKNLTLYGAYKELDSPISIYKFIDVMAKEAEMRGIYIRLISSDFELEQTDYDKLSYNYSIELEVYDIYNRTGKRINISNKNLIFDINGMPDPLFMRYAKISNINLDLYPSIHVRDNPIITLAGSGVLGQGWVYGRLFHNINDISDHDEPNILVGDFNYLYQFANDPRVDGFIITNFVYATEKRCRFSTAPYPLPDGNDTEWGVFNNIVHEEVPIYDENGTIISYKCNKLPPTYFTSKQWIAIPNTLNQYDINDYGNKTILILTNNPTGDEFNKYSYPLYLYKIESLRDFVNCGYYFKLPQRAPSYLQRFLTNGHQLNHIYGIDVLIIEDEFLQAGVSSLLSERFRGATGLAIRGLAGCKLSCSSQNSTKISLNIASYLGLDILLTNLYR